MFICFDKEDFVCLCPSAFRQNQNLVNTNKTNLYSVPFWMSIFILFLMLYFILFFMLAFFVCVFVAWNRKPCEFVIISSLVNKIFFFLTYVILNSSLSHQSKNCEKFSNYYTMNNSVTFYSNVHHSEKPQGTIGKKEWVHMVIFPPIATKQLHF